MVESMQCARARDQLPPTMDHKGTVEISSEYHAVGGMGMRAAGSHLTYERHLSMQEMRVFFWIVFSQATNYTSGYQCLQVSTEQIKSG